MLREEHSDYLERWATTPGLGIGWENDGNEPEPSIALFASIEDEIRRVVLTAQVERYRALADACERTRWEAEMAWEELTAELNALGGEVN